MREIMVWAGEHPEESASCKMVDSLEHDPIPNVHAGIANKLGRLMGRRLVDTNMAFAYPGDRDSPLYEERRATEVLKESQGFDAVVNLHSHIERGVDMAGVDVGRGIDPVSLGFLGSLGIRKIFLSDYDGLIRHADNAFTLELDPNGMLGDTDKMRAAFDRFANYPEYSPLEMTDFRWFKLITAGAHISRVDPAEIPELVFDDLDNFRPLLENIAARLGVENTPVYAFEWKRTPNMAGYWAELMVEVPAPDAAAWDRRDMAA